MTHTTPNAEHFLRDLLNDWDGSLSDIEGGHFQDLLLRHGFAIERPATDADCATERAEEEEWEVGDTIIAWSDEMLRLMRLPK